MVITFRPLQEKDYSLLASWLSEPHVAKWWHEPSTVEFVAKEYGPSDDKTDVYIVEGDDQPIGIIQSYWIEDYPEHFEKVRIKKSVGIDLLIGMPDLTGKGYGTQSLREFITKIVRSNYIGAEFIVADPEAANAASVRTFEKVGFKKDRTVSGGHGHEQLMVLELPLDSA
jgi:aminoglycoside 6'-N-acetyltransferase